MDRLYPRPQLQRVDWINLNGYWDFDFDDKNVGIDRKWYVKHAYSKKILVPFPYQSKLSEIHDVSIHDRVWYHRKFSINQPKDKRTMLHFGAVDYETQVYVNHKLVGTHTGGSTSFSFDITDHLVADIEQDLVLMVYDPSLDSFISRGKQTWRKEPFECFYDRTTGIWQTVWIEFVDTAALKKLRMTPNIDEKTVCFELTSFDESLKQSKITISFNQQELLILEQEFSKRCRFNVEIPKDAYYLWSPEMPNLYDVSIELYKNGQKVDSVKSYVGLRKISVEGNKVLLNNEPYYLKLILDQGYYPDSLLAYPTEEDLLNDIKIAKQMGFNGCRKHQKIEAERFMYYADKEGYLVSLEMPSQYSYKANTQFGHEWFDAIERDYNHPSLFMYIPFNESWGVRDVKNSKEQQDYITGFYHLTKSLDPTRIVVTNDGWEQTITDVCAIHTYRHGKIDDPVIQKEFHQSLTDLDTLLTSIHTSKNHPIYVGEYGYRGEPIILSEFGGVSFANQKQNGWGYTGVDNQEDYLKELKRIFDVVYASKHFAGFCYTQLTDVEQEINGLLTYDRKEKGPLDVIKKIICNEE